MLFLQPVRVGPARLRNRIAVSGHTTNFADDQGLPSQRLIDYHSARARGGVGLIISSGIRVFPASRLRYKLAAFPTGAAEAYGRLAAAIHEHGAAFFTQLSETGRTLSGDDSAPLSASDVPWRTGGPIPHALSPAEIGAIVEAFAAAAATMRRASVDGLEIQLGHGLLLQQFLSPLSNRRSDGYGGSLANRARFALEVLEAVRRAVDDQLVVGLRISATEFAPGGLTPEDMLAAVAHLRERVGIDYLNVSHSAYLDAGSDSLSPQVADMYHPPAPYRQLPALFRRELAGIPVIAVCRVDSLEVAEELLAEGVCDVVAMTRAHIADPDLVRKWTDGNAHLTQRCVACNQGCVGNLELGRPITCVVNPGVGREGSGDRYRDLVRSIGALRARPATPGRRVLVVGAGPAGLEAAVEARQRGYDVTLAERDQQAGGQLLLAAALSGRELWRRVVEDRLTLLGELGVELRLGWEATAAAITGGGWDHVVVATGSTTRARSVEGLGRVPTVEDVLVDEASLAVAPPATVVVLDDHGGWPGIGMAYHLAQRGYRVHLLSRGDVLAPSVTMYSKLGHMHRLGRAGVRTHLLRQVVRVADARLEIADVLSGDVEVLAPVDGLVWAGPRRADDGLAQDLVARGYDGALHVIGDAYAPRSVLEAVREGRRFAERLPALLA